MLALVKKVIHLVLIPVHLVVGLVKVIVDHIVDLLDKIELKLV